MQYYYASRGSDGKSEQRKQENDRSDRGEAEERQFEEIEISAGFFEDDRESLLAAQEQPPGEDVEESLLAKSLLREAASGNHPQDSTTGTESALEENRSDSGIPTTPSGRPESGGGPPDPLKTNVRTDLLQGEF